MIDHGIVLKSFDYKERSRIITVFTRHNGLISLLSRKAKPNLTTPLCYGELLYSKGRSDLYSLKEGKVLNMHLHLRDSFELLQIASKMLQAILDTQFPEKSATPLFDLLLTYLHHLPRNPKALYTSFLLKLLKHEGHLHLSPEADLLFELQQSSSIEKLAQLDILPGHIEFAEKLTNTIQ